MTNHEELMDTLKEVNQVIQRAGRLRIGKSKVKFYTNISNTKWNGKY